MTQRARYQNPLMAFDVPDPDVIPLSGGGYAMVASSFDRRPGLPLWLSDDLVTWRPSGFVGGYQPLLQPSGGVWAPAIREHEGRVFVLWADPDRGVFASDAGGIDGPWSEPRLVLEGPGPIDPCPFWDSDGRAWIIHGWARSRAGFANRLDLVEVDTAMTAAVGPSRLIIDGDEVDGCSVLEGPKLYRRGDDYLVFAPAGGVETGWQYVFRSHDLHGPWAARTVLEQGRTAVNGPHQGAWVAGAGGEEWFIHFQHTPQHGRILHLQPLVWGDDGWPRVGAAVAGGAPEPVGDWPAPTPRPRTRPPARGARDAAPVTAGWHGRGADPDDLMVESDDQTVVLREGGLLARPLDARARRLEATLIEGEGAISLVGADHHRLRVAGSHTPAADDAAEVIVSEVVVDARHPVRLGIDLDGSRARFSVDGDSVGDWFTPTPSQWTGVEFGIAACGSEGARFAIGDTASA
jgi:hypothetical protein